MTFWAMNARITTSRIGNAALLKKRLTRRNQRTRALFPLFGQGGDEVEVAVLLRVVEAVADREAVGDFEADVGGRKVDPEPLRLGQQRAGAQRGGFAGVEVA